jgi:YegS/Rv2252/BmrU family lipid kinase
MLPNPLRRVKVIANPASAGDSPFLGTMNRIFLRHHIRWNLSVTNRYGDGKRFARKAAKKEAYDLVIALGGDGTICDVANGLVGRETPLAILAGGTGNAVAAELRVPHQLERALEQICTGQGQIQQVDMGKVGETYFLLRADTGLSTVVMQETSREMKERLGVLAYLASFARTFTEPPRQTPYRLLIDGQVVESRGAACIISNMGSVGTLGLTLGKRIRFDDGLLDVHVLRNDFVAVLAAAASMIDLTNFDEVFQHWRGREITIQAPEGQTVQCDAEPCTHTPVTITMVPQALAVFIPS